MNHKKKLKELRTTLNDKANKAKEQKRKKVFVKDKELEMIPTNVSG